MDSHIEKVDEVTRALLGLNSFKDKWEVTAWKSHSWDALDRLHQKGYISDPRSKAKCVVLTGGGKEGPRTFRQAFCFEDEVVAGRLPSGGPITPKSPLQPQISKTVLIETDWVLRSLYATFDRKLAKQAKATTALETISP